MKNFQVHLPQGDPEVMYRDDLDIIWTAKYLTYPSYLQEFGPNYKLAILLTLWTRIGAIHDHRNLDYRQLYFPRRIPPNRVLRMDAP